MRAAWAVLELCTTVNRLGDVSYATQLVDREDGGYFLPGVVHAWSRDAYGVPPMTTAGAPVTTAEPSTRVNECYDATFMAGYSMVVLGIWQNGHSDW